MKKTIIAAVLGVGVALGAYGQGYVTFANNSASYAGITYLNGPDAGLGVASECLVTLYYGAQGTSDYGSLTALSYSDTSGDSSPIAAGLLTASSPGAVSLATGCGYFNGGAVGLPTSGGTYAMAIYAESVINGITYSGWSTITDVTVSSGLATPPNLPAGLGGFTIAAPVPEPSTLALAGLGGFGMLMALRRKKA